jgi:hypothetical protein
MLGLSTYSYASCNSPEIIHSEADSIKDKNEKKTLGEFLLVVGSFSDEMEAIYYFNKLCNKEISAYFYYDKPKAKFYVHIGRYYFEEDASTELKKNPYPQLKKSIKRVKSYPQE